MEQQETLSSTTSHVHTGNADDAEYDAFLGRIQARFLRNTQSGAIPLFATDADSPADPLFGRYLGGFDETQRGFHNCHACRHFIQRFGHLAVIDEDGSMRSAVWDEDDAPAAYKASIAQLARSVRRAEVTGPFLPELRVWGQPITGIWKHMALRPLPEQVYRNGVLLDAEQWMASKRQDYKTVLTALQEFGVSHVATAVSLLKGDALYRSEKVLGQAEWLEKLHQARHAAMPGRARDNVLWLAIATAPDGFCHPRSSMIGSLLEDIAAGMPFGVVSARFAAKMQPLQYMRPQAAPTAGNIAAAEATIAKLGLERSLLRRFARVEEIKAIWRPSSKPSAPAGAGVFSHLSAKSAPAASLDVPSQVMTFEKFARTVLPGAEAVDLFVEHSGNFGGLVTAVDLDAPPILQWDLPEDRNPVSWYLYAGHTDALQWTLTPNAWTKVTAVSLQPNDTTKFTHFGKGVMFVLEGARDTRSRALHLFPETLKSDLHGIRSTIEAHSKSRTADGAELATACGVMFQSGAPHMISLRVTSGGVRTIVKLDRWD